MRGHTLALFDDDRLEHPRRFRAARHQRGQTAQSRLICGESLILRVYVALPGRTFACGQQFVRSSPPRSSSIAITMRRPGIPITITGNLQEVHAHGGTI